MLTPFLDSTGIVSNCTITLRSLVAPIRVIVRLVVWQTAHLTSIEAVPAPSWIIQGHYYRVATAEGIARHSRWSTKSHVTARYVGYP